MIEPKYKLIPAGKMPVSRLPVVVNKSKLKTKKYKFYQIRALRDIPMHNVKAGDLGGFVTWEDSLSHEGSCWIGEKAQVIGKVTVSGDAYIGDRAIIHRMYNVWDNYNPGTLEVKGNARIFGNARIETHRFNTNYPLCHMVIDGNAQISGNAVLQNVKQVTDDAKIYGNALVELLTTVSGSTEIFDDAKISPYCEISGASKIFEEVFLERKVRVINSVIAGNAKIDFEQKVINGKLNKAKIGMNLNELEEESEDSMVAELASFTVPAKENIALRIFNDVKENIASYETDVVKLIKYPAMVDKSIPETLAMTVALKMAVRYSEDPDSAEFHAAVKELDQKFIIAESNAIKMTSTLLSDEEKKKTEKARDLLAIAADEASSENEKKVSFKQAFKQLEGVIAVPEIAVDTFRVKIGLKEIEA